MEKLSTRFFKRFELFMDKAIKWGEIPCYITIVFAIMFCVHYAYNHSSADLLNKSAKIESIQQMEQTLEKASLVNNDLRSGYFEPLAAILNTDDIAVAFSQSLVIKSFLDQSPYYDIIERANYLADGKLPPLKNQALADSYASIYQWNMAIWDIIVAIDVDTTFSADANSEYAIINDSEHLEAIQKNIITNWCVLNPEQTLMQIMLDPPIIAAEIPYKTALQMWTYILFIITGSATLVIGIVGGCTTFRKPKKK